MFAFPVSYELTILFTAFATIGGMFLLVAHMTTGRTIPANGTAMLMNDERCSNMEKVDSSIPQ